MEKIDREPNAFHRSDYPIARVAYEVYELRATLSAIFGSRLPNKDLKDFIPVFVTEAEQMEIDERQKQEMIQERAERSKQIYLGLVGLGPDGKPVDNRTPSERVLASILEQTTQQITNEAEKPKEAQGAPQENPYRQALLSQCRVVKGRKGS